MHKSNIDLRKLYHALVLADLGSFTLASEKLNLTQSALSRSIRALEDEIMLSLFARGRRGAVATKEGREFLGMAREVYGSALHLKAFGHSLAVGDGGDVSVGLGTSVAHLVLPDLLPRTLETWPNLSLVIKTAPAHTLIDEVIDGKCDFAVLTQHRPAHLQLLDVHHLTPPLRGGFFVRAGHPLAADAAPDRNGLNDFTIAAGAATLAEIRRSFGSRQRVVVCEQADSLRNLALRSDAIWATLEPLARDDVRQRRLIELNGPEMFDVMGGPLPITRFGRNRIAMSPAATNVSGIIGDILMSRLAEQG